MNYVLSGLKPEKVLRYFEEISAIPRGSGNEKAIADYLVAFSEARSLEVMRDEANNVMITKAGVGCRADAPFVMLQGHTDMVCEAEAGCEHDFTKDGIKLILDGDTVSADRTTLGGDDGIAVAVMLALLDGDSDVTPPLECLFTTGEEVGLDGMQALDCSAVKSRLLINIDSEDEGVATVACAGGVRTDFTLPVTFEKATGKAYEVTITGLAGGHSGAEINCFRTSANKLSARLATAALADNTFRLVSIDGGSKDNAITREAKLVFVGGASAKLIEAEFAKMKHELSPADMGCKVEIAEAKAERTMTRESSEKVLAFIRALPYGVLSMCRNVEGLVETSSNIGVVKTETDCVKVTSSSRSSVETRLDDVISRLEGIAYLAGASVKHRARYPGWDATGGSPLQDTYARVYEAKYGKAPRILGIHAGLECGIVKGRIPDMDIISIGPDMKDIHTPNESFSISSLNRTYELIKAILTDIAR